MKQDKTILLLLFVLFSMSHINPIKSYTHDGVWTDNSTVIATSLGSTVVTNTNDSGPGSLREAINCVNANTTQDLISFNIPGVGPHIINVLTELPYITDSDIILDATTQPGWSLGNIVIDGSGAGGNVWGLVCASLNFELYGVKVQNFDVDGLTVLGAGCTIGDIGKGNVFVANGQAGISFQNATNSTVYANQIGVLEDGNTPSANIMGIWTYASKDITIGKSGGGNTISANSFDGIAFGSNAFGTPNIPDTNFLIQYNYIGTNAGGIDLGNGGNGISLYSSSESAANVDIYLNEIAYNDQWGVYLDNALATFWGYWQNSFYCNTLGGVYHAPNANFNIQPPVITLASSSLIEGTADPGALVALYTIDTSCPSYPCQAVSSLGTTTADGNGDWSMSGSFVLGTSVTANQLIQTTDWYESAFSNCMQVAVNVCATVVTNTNDSGPGSLREAINCVNANSTQDLITFNIPGAGPHMINVLTNLPNITDDDVIIDATTQPSWALGNIVIDGSALTGNAWGARISGDNFELYGIKIRNFNLDGIVVHSDGCIIGDVGKGNVFVANGQAGISFQNATNSTAYANHLGVLEDGNTPSANREGFWTFGSKNITIGKNGGGNIISANTSYGIQFGFTPTTADSTYTIQYNYIGTNAGGIDLGNGASGIVIEIAAENVDVYSNQIAYNDQFGIRVGDASAIFLDYFQNSFYCNALGGVSYTANANFNIQPPVITSALSNLIEGTADPGADVALYATDTSCPTYPCQAISLLGTVTADANGDWSIAGSFTSGALVTTNQTLETTDKYTSELSNCMQVVYVCSTVVTNTNDSGPGSLRDAIDCVNANPTQDLITFNIPGAGPHMINVLTPMPYVIDDDVVIDATTQPSWSLGNIVIDGSLATSATGLSISGDNFELYGVKVQNFGNNGIAIVGSSVVDRVAGCIIGDVGKGNVFVANGQSGIFFIYVSNSVIYANHLGVLEDGNTPSANREGIASYNSENITIGKNGGGNIISANNECGIVHTGAPNDSNYTIQYNYIGTNAGGMDLGNGKDGIMLFYTGNSDIYYNQIAYNDEWGIEVSNNVTFVSYLQNSFYCNTLGGVSHGSPVNFYFQPPIITSALSNSIAGTAAPGADIEIFVVDTSCPSYPCQAVSFLGTTTADGNGDWSIAGSFLLGASVIANQTLQTTDRYSSEFSNCMLINDCPTNLYLNSPYNTFLDIEVSNIITADNVISGSANVTYDAGNCIDLQPDFEVVLGAEFHAFIDGCGNLLTNDETDRSLKENSDTGTKEKMDIIPERNK